MANPTRHSTRVSRFDHSTTAWSKRHATKSMNGAGAIRMPETLGESVWVDALQRDAIDLGVLQALIEQDGIAGALCARSLSLAAVGAKRAAGAPSEHVAVRDAQDAADLLQNRHLISAGRDGLVSVELSTDSLGGVRRTFEEARALWNAIGRRNLMIGVPGVRAYLPVIRDLTAAGINVHATTLYGIEHYREAFEAYCAGLEARCNHGEPISHLQFIASFCLDVIDQHIDALLDEYGQPLSVGDESLRNVAGRCGIAYATVIHRRAQVFAASERFTTLTTNGAQRPRLLWILGSGASSHHAVSHYLDSLVRTGALCAMPSAAIESCRHAGVLAWRRYAPPIEQELTGAMHVVLALRKAGVDLDHVAHELQTAHAAKRAARARLVS